MYQKCAESNFKKLSLEWMLVFLAFLKKLPFFFLKYGFSQIIFLERLGITNSFERFLKFDSVDLYIKLM